ncbi:MAG: thioredoxin-disulfide reductase [Bacteroidota bacterium]
MSTENGENKHEKVIIIGSGPAGYTAAIYASRAELHPLMFSGMQPGGQLMITNDVENYPGYPTGIMGPEMMEDFRKQAERFGTRMKYENIVEVDLHANPKKLVTDGGDEYTADAVIISTGASAKWLGIDAEERYMNRGVSACAVCDGYFFRGQEVAIVGAGDTAAEEALYLSKVCSKVHMLVRRDEMRASKIMQARVRAAENIEIYWNTEAKDLSGEEKVEAVHVINNQTQEESVIPVGAFFVAIGHKPSTEIFEGQLDMDEAGYIINKAGTSLTNIEGVFVSGDAADNVYRQAVTAAGTGCMAALDAERWLAAKEAAIA